MTTLADLFDLDLFERMKSEGFLRATRHPSLPLSIVNYTAAAQYGREWNEVTLQCRGLIHDDAGQVVARPFPKFFNLAEHPDGHPDMRGPFTVAEKLDGSLGIVWHYGSTLGVATPGSFTSEQAQWATAWLNERMPDLVPVAGGGDGPCTPVTILTEIIYPANRIVLDYGDRAEMVLLAVLDTATGKRVEHGRLPMTPARTYEAGDLTPAEVTQLDPTGEGFVLTFTETGFRVKVKHDEYVRLHKIITGSSTKTVWQHLANGGDWRELAENVPDEFHQWLWDTACELLDAFDSEEERALNVFSGLEHLRDDRKAFAEGAKWFDNPAILFRMLDGREYASVIWKSLKPVTERPYTNVLDDAA